MTDFTPEQEGANKMSLLEIDELLDAVEPQSPRWLYLPEQGFVRLRERAPLGYTSLHTYRRDLAEASAIHGPRLQRRLNIAVAERWLHRLRSQSF